MAYNPLTVTKVVNGMRPPSPVHPFRQRSNFCHLAVAMYILLLLVFYRYYLKPCKIEEKEALIIVITPTHKRLERLADMTRLAQTLQHIKNLHWLVVEDGYATSPAVERLLVRTGIPYVYLYTRTEKGMPARGWTHRNLALSYVREQYADNTNAVIYFADDDNSYDIRLFNKYIRNVKRVGMWGVGLSGEAYVEAPKVENGTVTGWDVVYAKSRKFATDMAGFAIHLREIKRSTASFNRLCAARKLTGPESCFLEQFGWQKSEIEPFGYDEEPKDVLVWHTKTKKTPIARGSTHGYVVEK